MVLQEQGLTRTAISLAVRAHLKSFWPSRKYIEEPWPNGPILRTIPHFRVARMLPNDKDKTIVYCTVGCFSTERSEHIRHEFLLISPEGKKTHIETLAMLANYHADERNRLRLGRIIEIGEPWMKGSLCDHFLVSLPYPFGPKLEWLKLGAICVRFLWTLPITAREAAFAELNGIEALEKKFDTVGINYVDPYRASVV